MSNDIECHSCQRNSNRASWGSGPWDNEPNRVEFEHAGLPCILHRGGGGAWCGYVGLSPSHPLFGKSYGDIEEISVHGNLTYSEPCAGCVCHVPKPGEPEDLWWLGFDCSHGGDLRPAGRSFDGTLSFILPDLGGEDDGHYWTESEAKTETCDLAEQLAALVVEA